MAELDDDREGAEPEISGEDDAGDPAAAFEALRQKVENLAGDLTREMTTIRKGVEAAFEEFDRHGPAQDYKPELAHIVQQLAHVAERLHGVEQAPVLRQGADHYARALERSGEGLIRTAVQELERQARPTSSALVAIWPPTPKAPTIGKARICEAALASSPACPCCSYCRVSCRFRPTATLPV